MSALEGAGCSNDQVGGSAPSERSPPRRGAARHERMGDGSHSERRASARGSHAHARSASTARVVELPRARHAPRMRALSDVATRRVADRRAVTNQSRARSYRARSRCWVRSGDAPWSVMRREHRVEQQADSSESQVASSSHLRASARHRSRGHEGARSRARAGRARAGGDRQRRAHQATSPRRSYEQCSSGV